MGSTRIWRFPVGRTQSMCSGSGCTGRWRRWGCTMSPPYCGRIAIMPTVDFFTTGNHVTENSVGINTDTGELVYNFDGTERTLTPQVFPLSGDADVAGNVAITNPYGAPVA